MLFGYEKLNSLIISIYFVSLRYLHLGVCRHDFQQKSLPGKLVASIQLLKTFFQCGKEALISNFFFRVCSKSANSED